MKIRSKKKKTKTIACYCFLRCIYIHTIKRFGAGTGVGVGGGDSLSSRPNSWFNLCTRSNWNSPFRLDRINLVKNLSNSIQIYFYPNPNLAKEN